MRATIPRVLISAVVLAQLVWGFSAHLFESGPAQERYHRERQLTAFEAWSLSPTPATEAAWLREKNRDWVFEKRLCWTLFGMLLALDAGLVYFFWNYGGRKRHGLTCAAPNGGPATQLGNSGASGGPPSVS
jgi:hypothetical protein